MRGAKTKHQILAIAREIAASDGIGAVSFDAIARRLGRSKQAVLYWYPSKRDLLAALFLPWLEEEAKVATAGLPLPGDREASVSAFVRAVARFHLSDLDRFRLMYLAPQVIRQGPGQADDGRFVTDVHPVTDRLYGALARHLGRGDAARREAFAIHAAVLGQVLMIALADALEDPLKHGADEVVDALVATLSAA